MKNKEVYKEYILDLFSNSDDADICDFKINKVYNLKPNKSCEGITCRECGKITKKWLESEYEEKPEPCPVCGEIPRVGLFTEKPFYGCYSNEDVYNVSCENLDCEMTIETKPFNTEQEAIRSWNDNIRKIKWQY